MTWSSTLPRARTVTATLPKPVTLVYPYYENPTFLSRQIAAWKRQPAEVTDHLALIVVDDGSPMTPASDVIAGVSLPFPMHLFRIDVDVPWNWLAARNIGLHHAATEWVLMTDMDHVVPGRTLRSLVYGLHDPDVMYAFARLEHTGAPVHPHSASFLLTRALFWKIGGYDETLSGHYGTDGDWRRRATKVAPIKVLSDHLVRHEHVEDASTKRYQRKLPSDAAAVQQLVAARGAGWMPKTLSFPYREVTL